MSFPRRRTPRPPGAVDLLPLWLWALPPLLLLIVLFFQTESDGHVSMDSQVPEDDERRQGDSLDGRRLPCKRKNGDGDPGQSSAGRGLTFFYGESEIGSLRSGLNPIEEQPNPSVDAIIRGPKSDHHFSINLSGNRESSQRDSQMRVNSVHQNKDHNNGHSAHQQCSPSSPFNQPLESVVGSSSSHSQQPHFQNLPQNVQPIIPCNGTSNSRMGISSTSLAVTGENVTLSREEKNEIFKAAKQSQPEQDRSTWVDLEFEYMRNARSLWSRIRRYDDLEFASMCISSSFERIWDDAELERMWNSLIVERRRNESELPVDDRSITYGATRGRRNHWLVDVPNMSHEKKNGICRISI